MNRMQQKHLCILSEAY